MFSYINIVVFFFQILVLIFTDVCCKSLREKNGDAHKGIQNVTICIGTCLKYRDAYRDKNSVSVSLHSKLLSGNFFNVDIFLCLLTVTMTYLKIYVKYTLPIHFFCVLQVNYCNQNCQKLHWSTHKKFCKSLAG